MKKLNVAEEGPKTNRKKTKGIRGGKGGTGDLIRGDSTSLHAGHLHGAGVLETQLRGAFNSTYSSMSEEMKKVGIKDAQELYKLLQNLGLDLSIVRADDGEGFVIMLEDRSGNTKFGARAGKSPQPEDLRVDDVGPNIRKLGTMIYWISKLRDPINVNTGTRQDPPQGRPVIVTNPGFVEIDENALGKRVKKIFSGKYGGVKKNITASLLRKIFITSEFKGDTEKKMRIAALMNHSVKIQQAIYYKQEEKQYGDKIMTGDDLNEVESNQIPVDYWTKKHLHTAVVEE